ncbi:hypothetical protein [Actinokineospora diospyrosa]|uniref:Excreted virulence factor EspC (Type VII ESX diderm) n=1 Tax=Actinokineospora diospyrosa TaxID=103728 RepID=A0ABT1I944_9PSEU|nr:hypothetical protein [Actinokineospora diospyrosa]MCP2269076.1 hypothetical protein [Actinokineospora diospyrosa]
MYSSDGGPAGAIGSVMGEFAALAARGGFAVNEHGGDALLKAIRSMIRWIDDQELDLQLLTQRAKLGSSSNAMVMAPFLQQVATDSSGFITQLTQLRKSLTEADQAIVQAMANYQREDHEAAGSLS